MTNELDFLLDSLLHYMDEVVAPCTVVSHLRLVPRPEPLQPNGRFHLLANLPRLEHRIAEFLGRGRNHYHFQSARYPSSSYYLVIQRQPREQYHLLLLRQSYRGRQIVGRKLSPLHGQPAVFRVCRFQNLQRLVRFQIRASFSMIFRLWPLD